MYGNNVMRELDGGAWAEINPSVCPCQGDGWMLSGYDTWHKCPVHNVGQTHPECDNDDDYDSMPDGRPLSLTVRPNYRRMVYITAFRTLRNRIAKMLNLSYEDANEHIRPMVQEDTPEGWVNAATDLADHLHTEQMDTKARAMGYSCRLEAALSTAGRAEVAAIHMGMSHEAAEREGLRESSDWY